MTVVYSAECKAARKSTREVRLLPILVVLFIFSYAILTTLVIEQSKTIESQRGLIREMLQDSSQLAALKGKIAREESQRQHEKASAQATAPSAGDQSKDSVPAGAPPGPGKDAKQAGKPTHSMKEIPGKPASDLQDVRRSTRII